MHTLHMVRNLYLLHNCEESQRGPGAEPRPLDSQADLSFQPPQSLAKRAQQSVRRQVLLLPATGTCSPRKADTPPPPRAAPSLPPAASLSSPVPRVDPAGGFGGVVDIIDFAVVVASCLPALGQRQLLPGHLLWRRQRQLLKGGPNPAAAAAPCKELSNPPPSPAAGTAGWGEGPRRAAWRERGSREGAGGEDSHPQACPGVGASRPGAAEDNAREPGRARLTVTPRCTNNLAGCGGSSVLHRLRG